MEPNESINVEEAIRINSIFFSKPHNRQRKVYTEKQVRIAMGAGLATKELSKK